MTVTIFGWPKPKPKPPDPPNLNLAAIEETLKQILAAQVKQATQLAALKVGQEKIMTGQEIANAALTKIDQETTAQGVVLAQEADTLTSLTASQNTISDEIKALLAKTPDLPADFVTSITAKADALGAQTATMTAMAASLKAQADFSAQLASQGADNPVPVPVPTPTPEQP